MLAASGVVDRQRIGEGKAHRVHEEAREHIIKGLAHVGLRACELAEEVVHAACSLTLKVLAADGVGRAASHVSSAVKSNAGGVSDGNMGDALHFSLAVKEVISQVQVVSDVFHLVRELADLVSDVLDLVAMLINKAVDLILDFFVLLDDLVLDAVDKITDPALDRAGGVINFRIDLV